MARRKFNPRKVKTPSLKDLPHERQAFLNDEADEIRSMLGKDVEQVLNVGDRLIAIKNSLEHGMWHEWVKNELKTVSQSTIENYIRAAEWRAELVANGKSVNFTGMSISSLFDLSRKGTPEAAKQKVVEASIASPRPIAHHWVAKVIKEEKAKDKPAPPPEPDAPPSPHKALTKEEFAQIGDDITKCLRGNEELWAGLLTIAVYKGFRLLMTAPEQQRNLTDLPNKFHPSAPEHWPDWVRDSVAPQARIVGDRQDGSLAVLESEGL